MERPGTVWGVFIWRLSVGRPAKVKGHPCSVDGCDRDARTKGMCPMHYMRVWKNGSTETLTNGRRSHPLYSIWFERKQRGSLCPEWADDIFAMAQIVGVRPKPTDLLRRPNSKAPYSPDNWEWFPALKRGNGETKKAFNARKWADRREREPEYEHRRWLERKYALTVEEYEGMREAQGDRCAICREEERSIDSRTGTKRSLAVDHLDDPHRVRGLLCFRCNSMIGQVKDCPKILQSMIDYVTADYAPRPTPTGRRKRAIAG